MMCQHLLLIQLSCFYTLYICLPCIDLLLFYCVLNVLYCRCCHHWPWEFLVLCALKCSIHQHMASIDNSPLQLKSRTILEWFTHVTAEGLAWNHYTGAPHTEHAARLNAKKGWFQWGKMWLTPRSLKENSLLTQNGLETFYFHTNEHTDY